LLQGGVIVFVAAGVVVFVAAGVVVFVAAGVVVFVAAGVVVFITAGVVVFIAAWHCPLSSSSLHSIVAFNVIIVIAVALAAVQLSEH
jgi:hypothetical protein